MVVSDRLMTGIVGRVWDCSGPEITELSRALRPGRPVEGHRETCRHISFAMAHLDYGLLRIFHLFSTFWGFCRIVTSSILSSKMERLDSCKEARLPIWY